ncbi:MAG: phytanoyl-CoA dioxygenase family protein [Acidimicrobiales bacterium]
MQPVTSNGVAVPCDPDHAAPLRESTALLGDGAALRARYQADGYVYLRGVLRPEALTALRGAYFSQFPPAYLAPETTPAEGVFSGRRPEGLPAHGVAGHPAHSFVRGDAFARFVAQPVFSDLASQILGGRVERLPRSIIRHFDRAAPTASRAHLDHTYLDQGSDELVTIWIPIGDCSRRRGALMYLERSHQLGEQQLAQLRADAVPDRPGDRRPISHDLGWVAERIGRRWLWADYAAGDLTMHSPHIVHASLDTATDAMRLSVDLRFIRAGRRIDPRWLRPWAGDDGN